MRASVRDIWSKRKKPALSEGSASQLASVPAAIRGLPGAGFDDASDGARLNLRDPTVALYTKHTG